MRTLIFCLFFLASSVTRSCSTGEIPEGECLDAGCGWVDAGLDYATASCAQLSDEFDRLVADVGTSCDVPGDCARVGGANRWCEAYPSLGESAGGRAVNAHDFGSGPHATDLYVLTTQFTARCEGHQELCGLSSGLCTYDAGPIAVTCANHVCVGSIQSCNSNADAGP